MGALSVDGAGPVIVSLEWHHLQISSPDQLPEIDGHDRCDIYLALHVQLELPDNTPRSPPRRSTMSFSGPPTHGGVSRETVHC